MRRINEPNKLRHEMDCRELAIIKFDNNQRAIARRFTEVIFLYSFNIQGASHGLSTTILPLIRTRLKEMNEGLDGSVVSRNIDDSDWANDIEYRFGFKVEEILILSEDEGNRFLRYGVLPTIEDEEKKPLSLMAKGYKSDTIYRGFNSYHSSHGIAYNTPLNNNSNYKFGVELEVEFADSYARKRFTDIERNWYFCESDSSLNSGGCEIITIPLLPKDAKNEIFWQSLVDKLNELKAKSWNSPRTGLHVHVSTSIFGDTEEKIQDSIGKTLYLYHSFLDGTEINTRIFGRSTGYHAHEDPKTEESKAAQVLGPECMKNRAIAEKVTKSLKDRAKSTRYFDINLANMDSIHTVEFRKGKGSIHARRIAGIIEWVELICKYSTRTRIQDISLDHFMEFVKKNTKKTSFVYSKFSEEE